MLASTYDGSAGELSSPRGRLLTMSCRAIFLDRDGVVNKVVFRNGTPSSPRTLDEFELEADGHKSIWRLKAAGFKIFVVSNQPDLARGHLTRAALDAMTGTVLATL